MTDRHDGNDTHLRTIPADDADVGGQDADVRQATGSGGQSLDPGVARDLSELARELQAEPDPQAVMDRVVAAAVSDIPGATAAAITLVERGQVRSAAHSGDLAAQVGTIQSRTGQGPGVDTARKQITIRSADLRTESRWPKFAAEAAADGVLSVLSVQLFTATDSMGALDVYSDTADAFDDDAENTGLLLACHAAIAMCATRKAVNLHLAVANRDLIGQAKGVLMERYKIDAARAFDLLILSSKNTNTKLRDVADRLTATGELLMPNQAPDARPARRLTSA